MWMIERAWWVVVQIDYGFILVGRKGFHAGISHIWKIMANIGKNALFGKILQNLIAPNYLVRPLEHIRKNALFVKTNKNVRK